MKQLVLGMILMIGLIPNASAAQLDASISFEDQITEPSFEFLRVLYIEYPEGGEIAQSLQGKNDVISFGVDGEVTQELVKQINQSLESISSNAIATDVKVMYQTTLQGNSDSAVIEYKIQMIPTLTNHIFKEKDQKSIVDASWRGITIDEPIIIQSSFGEIDINSPRTALDLMIPNVSEKFEGVDILSLSLVDASGIKELPISRWHFLFDPTAILASVSDFKEENVVSHYSMGECTIVIGVCDDREWIEEIKLDKKYTIRMIESRDDAVIALEGYADSTYVGGFEVFQVNLKAPIPDEPEENDLLVMTMYGMAAIGVIGAVGMFVLSNQKLKKDRNEGQTGIDPAHLRVYSTSDSAGGYKTNRGESILISDKKSNMPI